MDRAQGTRPAVWLSVLVAAVVLAGPVAACGAFGKDKPSVLLVGDSITQVSSAVLTDQMEGQYKVLASGAPKRRADERVHDLPLLVKTDPDAVVVNLGTNDVIQHQSQDVTMRAIDRIGTAFTTAKCVVLVTVNQDMYSAKDRTWGVDATQLNQRIIALAARRHWGVVRWDSIVHQYIAEGEKQGHLTVDTIHPRPIGQKLLADAYRRALAPCLAGKG